MRALRMFLGFLLGFVIGMVFFTSIGLAQGDLGRVVQGNLDIIARNHVRGDVANLEAQIHSLIYHQRYGYGYEDNGYFYGTDQYGRGNRGRVSVSPIEVGIGGAAIGGAVGGWKGAAIGGVGGYFGTKAVKDIVNHKRNKKAEKEAEAMAAQAQAQAEAEARVTTEKKIIRNNMRKSNLRVYVGADLIAELQPSTQKIVFITTGAEVWGEGDWEDPVTGNITWTVLGYGNGKRRLPQNAGWEFLTIR